MSTFFEKITGNAPEDGSPYVELNSPKNAEEEIQKESVKKGAPQPKVVTAASRTMAAPKPKPMHLKIESDPASEEKPDEEEDEEGELTVDIFDKGDAIIVQSTVAGVKPEDLDVSITSDSIAIRGKRTKMDEISDENYYYKELFWGTFARSIILPEEIEDEEAEASLKHGLLTIRLPKKKRGVVQKLKVKVT